MKLFVKPLLVSLFAAGSLAVAGGQRPAEPPLPPQPPFPPPAAVAPVGGVNPLRASTAQPPAGFGGMGAGTGGGSYYSPAEGRVNTARPLGDDPRTRDLAKKLADAKDDDARDKLRGELKDALGKAFDDRLKGQQAQIDELEKQLKRLKETVGKRREAKADIVADRLAALEKEAKGLGW